MPLLPLGTTAQAFQVINSVNPWVSKSNYFIDTLRKLATQVMAKISGLT